MRRRSEERATAGELGERASRNLPGWPCCFPSQSCCIGQVMLFCGLRCRVLIVATICLSPMIAGCKDASRQPDSDASHVVERSGATAACDDRVDHSQEPPAEAQAAGLDSGVGTGDIWFYAGLVDRWGDLVLHDPGGGFRGKFAMWVGTDQLPTVSVVRAGGEPLKGSVSLDPTAEGIPGPLPSTVLFPSPGCWQVTATVGADSAQILVKLP